MVNEILSKELQVKPLERGDVAIYRIIGAGQPVPYMQYADGSPVLAAPKVSIAGESVIVDPFDAQKPNKTITNATRTTPVRLPDGTIKQEEIVENVSFGDGGYKFVKFEQMQTYYYLERCNENRDNPYRDTGRKAIFERVQAAKKAKKDLDEKYVEYEAMSMVMEGGIDHLKVMATQLPSGMKVNLDAPIDQIKMDLLRVSEKNPRALIWASGNKDAKKNIQFRDALKFNILVWDEATREMHINKPSGLEKICDVPIGVDKFQELLKVTKEKDKVKYYQTLVMLLGKVYKATVS